MLDTFRPTRFKLATTLVVALVVCFYGWLKGRVMLHYVETSGFAADKPEFQKLFGEIFALMDREAIQHLTLKTTVTNGVVLVLLSYLAACVIAKLNERLRGS